MLKILVVEDNEQKRSKITSFLLEEHRADITQAFSYSSGLNKAISNEYDCLILDMSMPTFDKSQTETGGRLREFAGREIVRKLKRRKKNFKFLVITQFNTFSDNGKLLNLASIRENLKELAPNSFLGLIYYDTSKTQWKTELKKYISDL